MLFRFILNKAFLAKALCAAALSAGGLAGGAQNQEEPLRVVTTVMSLRSIAESVGGDLIRAESIAKGPWDPHFLEAKPSYALKTRKAAALILTGMDLEAGWLPLIISSSRNPRIQKGRPGYIDASAFIQPLFVPKGKINRFFGDIHPFGNPHFLLDPVRGIQVSKGISQKFSELDPKNREIYTKNQKRFAENLIKKIENWKSRIAASEIKSLVSYHNSFAYFLDRFQLNLAGLIEEKPGIPPSAKHILGLTQKMRETKTFCILMSSFQSGKGFRRIKESLPAARLETVAIEILALKEAQNYTLVIEGIVKAIESCGKAAKERGKAAVSRLGQNGNAAAV